ncbi:hypothetical protein ASG31_14675 [Chryseobacterium sp. Leaf404]|uniref:alpha-1,2-fucosyltransferase n=1 Tax=unclassified Chryseobacterium TaxID=2593645 RepID=UPI0006FA6831|nr:MULTISPECIES: alpha-1,2-fucosyltransferase [unclassified Chryseobacterium]KQT15504.1 hypothetical protein ASG31_14675 [Chryseobacterium sp. Leaf404]
MTITKLQGGLGNQMFQYAVARSRCVDEKIYLDFSFLQKNNVSTEHFTKRDFELGVFGIQYKEFSDRERKICFGTSTKDKILRKLFYGRTETVHQIENEFVIIPAAQNIYFDGYFQSEKYFASIRNQLLTEFTFPELDGANIRILDQINSVQNSVSIHIRRGDYLKPEVLKYHGSLGENYYKAGLELLKAKFPNLYYFVFSDDISFAKTLFKDLENTYFVNINSGKDSWKDMFLMAQCRHHIIANSSFSWWGAWLSQKQGINIAPENWFNKEVANFDINNIVPSDWITI